MYYINLICSRITNRIAREFSTHGKFISAYNKNTQIEYWRIATPKKNNKKTPPTKNEMYKNSYRFRYNLECVFKQHVVMTNTLNRSASHLCSCYQHQIMIHHSLTCCLLQVNKFMREFFINSLIHMLDHVLLYSFNE